MMTNKNYDGITRRHLLEQRAKNKRNRRIKATIYKSLVVVAAIGTIGFGAYKYGIDSTTHTYYAQTEITVNGNHYELVTDKKVEVVAIQNDLITVEDRKGNLYDFYGNGYTINQKIIATFNENGELIATK